MGSSPFTEYPWSELVGSGVSALDEMGSSMASDFKEKVTQENSLLLPRTTTEHCRGLRFHFYGNLFLK